MFSPSTIYYVHDLRQQVLTLLVPPIRPISTKQLCERSMARAGQPSGGESPTTSKRFPTGLSKALLDFWRGVADNPEAFIHWSLQPRSVYPLEFRRLFLLSSPTALGGKRRPVCLGPRLRYCSISTLLVTHPTVGAAVVGLTNNVPVRLTSSHVRN